MPSDEIRPNKLTMPYRRVRLRFCADPARGQGAEHADEERAAKLRDPAVRAAMKRDVEEWPNVRTDWSRVRVLDLVHARHD